MSAEHRRQLLAFFIVALAAVVLVGTSLHNQKVRDAISGHSGDTAGAIATGVTIIPGVVGVELGGSARGTTATEPVPVTTEPVLVNVAQVTESRGTSTARSTSPGSTPARSDQAPKATRAAQKSDSPGKSKKLTTLGRALGGSDVPVYRAGATAKVNDKSNSGHAKKALGKENGKKHVKKHGHGKSQTPQARRA